MTDNDNDKSPWWACPECEGIEFFAVVVFERGLWVDENNYEFEYPPTGIVNTVQTSKLQCVKCLHTVDARQEFGWIAPSEVPN